MEHAKSLFIQSKLYDKLNCFLFQHFLSYLNSLRVREYCTAFHNLFHYFDRNITLTSDTGQQDANQKNKVKEKAVCRRYAALNLAALHYRFGHK